MKIYINWDNREIKTETDFLELIDNTTSKKAETDYTLDDYLGEHYTYEEIFYFNEEQKQKIINKWGEKIKELVLDSVSGEWEEYNAEKI